MRLILALLVALNPGPIAEATPPPCPVRHREIVRVRSSLDDPRVLLWSDRHTLANYLEGRGSMYNSILHTRLLLPNTRVIVTSACTAETPRVVGVRVLDGLHRGAFGFVDRADVASN